MDIEQARAMLREEEENIRAAIQKSFNRLQEIGAEVIGLNYDMQPVHTQGARTQYVVTRVQLKVQL